MEIFAGPGSAETFRHAFFKRLGERWYFNLSFLLDNNINWIKRRDGRFRCDRRRTEPRGASAKSGDATTRGAPESAARH